MSGAADCGATASGEGAALPGGVCSIGADGFCAITGGPNAGTIKKPARISAISLPDRRRRAAREVFSAVVSRM